MTLGPPPLRDDCFALPAGIDWTPVDQALALLRGRLHPVVAKAEAPLREASGRILAAPVTALRPNPPEANTAVDGYGFAHASLPSGGIRSCRWSRGVPRRGGPMIAPCRRAMLSAF